MPNWSKALVAGTLALSIGTAQAAFILDTGPGTGGMELTLNNNGVSFQSLGVTFSVSQASSITSVEGWIAHGTGDVLFELHEGSGPPAPCFSAALSRLPMRRTDGVARPVWTGT